ncbi:hypothetical protein BGZ73_005382 [Actinomortierella ambigua]|nr:hypothetical protein BGZ73_005382 [Actinomortierella ambigua]
MTDCLARVIDFVLDTNTLYSLLTVNKAVFEIAVLALYRSPFLFDSLSKQRVRKLTCLFFSLLPLEADESFGTVSDLQRIEELTSLQVLCVYHEPRTFCLYEFVEEFVRIHGERGARRLHLELRGGLRRRVLDYLYTFELFHPERIVAPSRLEFNNFGPLYAYRDKADFSRVKEVVFHQSGYDIYLKPFLAKCPRLERLSNPDN